jgi:hypothetical protein
MKKRILACVLGAIGVVAIVHFAKKATAAEPAHPIVGVFAGPDIARESRIADRWRIELRNPNSQTCRVLRDRIIWDHGEKTVTPRDLLLEPRATSMRSISLPDAAVPTARIVVEARCH